ncbi:MAG TPA: chorismate mutase, partial [Denitromonas sp.]|nr:chorismate mutase [Denitromonas sp.]
MSEEQELLKLRNEIDAIDDAVLASMSRRGKLAQRVGEIKQGNIYRPEREAQVLRRLADAN